MTSSVYTSTAAGDAKCREPVRAFRDIVAGMLLGQQLLLESGRNLGIKTLVGHALVDGIDNSLS